MTGSGGGPPTQIFIIRHGEKPPAGPNPQPPFGIDADGTPNPRSLTPRGWQRCGGLGLLFTPTGDPIREGLSRPDHLVCPAYGADTPIHRTYQTMLSISARSGIAIESAHPEDSEHDLATALVADIAGTVLVCWEHKRIPRLAAALPAAPGTTIPTDWPSERFDLIWSFTLTTSPGRLPHYSFSQIPQLILDGDLID